MLRIPIKVKHRHLPSAGGRGSGPQGRINKMRELVTALIRHERIEGQHQWVDEARGYAERVSRKSTGCRLSSALPQGQRAKQDRCRRSNHVLGRSEYTRGCHCRHVPISNIVILPAFWHVMLFKQLTNNTISCDNFSF